MKKIIGILAVLASIVVLSSCGGKPKPFDYGTLEGTKYTNSYFRFSLQLPGAWYILDRDEIRALYNIGVNAIPNEALRGEISKAKDIKDATLVVAYNYEPGTQGVFNASFQTAVENISKHPEVRNGAQYLTSVIEMLKISGMSYTGLDNPIQSVEIGGVRFDHIGVKSDYMGYDINQDYYAAVREGFVLCFIATYQDTGQRDTIRGVLETVVFE